MKKLLTLAGILGGLALPSLAQQTYNQYDRNQDGQVTFAELRTSGVRVDNSIRNLDRNRDKILSRYELRNVQWGSNQQQYYNQQQNYNQGYNQGYTTNNNGYHWSNLDTNHNGILEAHELSQAGYNTNQNYNMNSIDLNRDGYIDQYEQQRAYNNQNYNNQNSNNQNFNGSTILNLLQMLPNLLNR